MPPPSTSATREWTANTSATANGPACAIATRSEEGNAGCRFVVSTNALTFKPVAHKKPSGSSREFGRLSQHRFIPVWHATLAAGVQNAEPR